MRFNLTFFLLATFLLLAGVRQFAYMWLPQAVDQERTSALWREAQARPFDLESERIGLHYTPMTNPISTYVILHEDGYARVMHYSPYLHIVSEAYQGRLSKPHAEDLFSIAKGSEFLSVFNQQSFTGVGMSRGDQFHLSVYYRDYGQKKLFGFLPDTPIVIQRFTNQMIKIKTYLAQSPLSYAYLKSKSISKKRFNQLKTKGKIQFLMLSNFPNEVEKTLKKVINHSHFFFGLTQTEYGLIFKRHPESRELFVSTDDLAYQLLFFKAQSESMRR